MNLEIVKNSKILIVDDEPSNLGVLLDGLCDLECTIMLAQNGESALEIACKEQPDLILLDIIMPGMDGFEVCRRLKENDDAGDISEALIIFITALSDASDKVRGFELGAVDFITKPFQREDVIARVSTHLGIRKLQKDLRENNDRLQQEIAYRRQSDKKLRASLEEKEVLLREIHHRVKNNMQVIMSLLQIQARKVGDRDVAAALQESRNRVRAMSVIHEMIYRSDSMAEISFRKYLTRLANHLFQTYRTGKSRIALKVAVGDDLNLSIDHAIPCGLIVNELISNALKHAFPDGRDGTIEMAIRPGDNDSIELVISDDGIGLPADIDPRNTHTMGLSMLISLAERQLGGTVEIKRDKGTQFCIKFSL